MTAAVKYPGLDALTDRAACTHCGHPVHNTGSGKTWIHTLTDTYRCPEYRRSWAEPMLEGDIETRIDEACAEAEEVGREAGYEDGRSDGESEGRDIGYIDGQKDGTAEGREAMHSEMMTAVNAALDEIMRDAAGAIDIAELRAELMRSLMRVQP